MRILHGHHEPLPHGVHADLMRQQVEESSQGGGEEVPPVPFGSTPKKTPELSETWFSVCAASAPKAEEPEGFWELPPARAPSESASAGAVGSSARNVPLDSRKASKPDWRPERGLSAVLPCREIRITRWGMQFTDPF